MGSESEKQLGIIQERVSNVQEQIVGLRADIREFQTLILQDRVELAKLKTRLNILFAGLSTVVAGLIGLGIKLVG